VVTGEGFHDPTSPRIISSSSPITSFAVFSCWTSGGAYPMAQKWENDRWKKKSNAPFFHHKELMKPNRVGHGG